jgi:hypothetical protein
MIAVVEQLILGVAYWFVVASIVFPLIGLLWSFTNFLFRVK